MLCEQCCENESKVTHPVAGLMVFSSARVSVSMKIRERLYVPSKSTNGPVSVGYLTVVNCLVASADRNDQVLVPSNWGVGEGVPFVDIPAHTEACIFQATDECAVGTSRRLAEVHLPHGDGGREKEWKTGCDEHL